MNAEHRSEHEPQVAAALAELRQLIHQRYPTATFSVCSRDDPDGVRLRVSVDVEDTDAVLDLVMDKLYELHVEQDLPSSVIAEQPLARRRAARCTAVAACPRQPWRAPVARGGPAPPRPDLPCRSLRLRASIQSRSRLDFLSSCPLSCVSITSRLP